MLSNFDFNVILSSLPYLFGQGMVFTVTLTAMAAVGGVIIGTLLAMARLSSVPGLSHIAKGWCRISGPT
jgi:glutamate/aspartate transport system permease protein